MKKKSKQSDLRRYRGLFFNIGLFISMSAIVFAFEWKSYEDMGLVDLNSVSDDFEELLEIPPTEQPPPPPPKIKQPEIIEIPDEEEIEEEIEVDLDVDITEETVIEDIIIEEAPEEEVADEVFQIVEEPATPVGGYQSFYEYISKNIRYPAQARRMGIEGRVFVQFVVGPNGEISEVETVRGIGAGCDEEAERLLKSAPNWNPPKQRGKAVKQRIMVRLVFQLN
ncbi:energy transducer TonB [Fulvivirga lutea]|uniref:Energy transducer TonB n=1 Tax=Fulvivirga lutea TaxID=2810512 RepID=A0A974WFV6_9BACT|nr:energy transducer TonB [Fulvivirga lutea]QSE97501.1 energy transducer TonB [Fulvivirga lutea]